MTATDLMPTVTAERRAFGDVLEGLTEAEWNAPSLCAGWRVRDVAAHLTLAHSGAADALPALLSFPLTVMAGTEDTKTTGRFFPKGPKSLKQGPTRYARAHRYLATAREAAARHAATLAWQVIDVPGVGHDGRRMSDAAAPFIAETLRRHATTPLE